MTSNKEKRTVSHVFHRSYVQLCKELGLVPLQAVKTEIRKNSLDFNVDKIKFDEWHPILSALRLDRSLHYLRLRSRHPGTTALEDIQTEEKARGVVHHPLIHTNFVLNLVIESLKKFLGITPVLTCLELQGLPLGASYLKNLCEGLARCPTLQNLSLYRSSIGDEGCKSLCSAIKNLPNIIYLDISACNISEEGIIAVCSLLKHQQLQRFNEIWKQSLRYRSADLDGMPGLRRLSLNHNILIGDKGVFRLVEQIKDDLWLKAIDLQNCDIGNEGACVIIKMLTCNQTLVIVDVRNNRAIDVENVERIMDILNANNADNYQETKEYPWIALRSCVWKTASSTTLGSSTSSSVAFRSPTRLNKAATRNSSSAVLRRQSSDNCKPNFKQKSRNINTFKLPATEYSATVLRKQSRVDKPVVPPYRNASVSKYSTKNNTNGTQDISLTAKKSLAKALEDSMEYVYQSAEKEFRNGEGIGLEVESQFHPTIEQSETEEPTTEAEKSFEMALENSFEYFLKTGETYCNGDSSAFQNMGNDFVPAEDEDGALSEKSITSQYKSAIISRFISKINQNKPPDERFNGQKSFATTLENSIEYVYKNGEKDYCNGDSTAIYDESSLESKSEKGHGDTCVPKKSTSEHCRKKITRILNPSPVKCVKNSNSKCIDDQTQKVNAKFKAQPKSSRSVSDLSTLSGSTMGKMSQHTSYGIKCNGSYEVPLWHKMRSKENMKKYAEQEKIKKRPSRINEIHTGSKEPRTLLKEGATKSRNFVKRQEISSRLLQKPIYQNLYPYQVQDKLKTLKRLYMTS